MSPVTVMTIKLFGDHPVLDFTNTVDSRGVEFGPDVLTDFRDLLRWGVRIGVIDAAAENALRNIKAKQGEAALKQRKITPRSALPDLRRAPVHSAAEADLDLLQQDVLAAQTMRVFVPDGAVCLALACRRPGYDHASHRIFGCRFAYLASVKPRTCLSGRKLCVAVS